MTDASSESTRNERMLRRRAELRGRYLDAMLEYLAQPLKDGLHAKIQSAFAFTLGSDDGLSEGVAIKFGMMLAGLRKQDEKAWAKFLSVHVGLDDTERFTAFKAQSPFKDAIIVERYEHPDGSITLRGDAQRYLYCLSSELVIANKHYLISDLNKIKKSFVALVLSEVARNRIMP